MYESIVRSRVIWYVSVLRRTSINYIELGNATFLYKQLHSQQYIAPIFITGYVSACKRVSFGNSNTVLFVQ